MIGHRFLPFNPKEEGKSKFEQLLDLFTQLLTYTNGDATEALDWLNQLDRQHHLTDNDYGIGDFIEDLKQNGYLTENQQDGSFKITSKSELGCWANKMRPSAPMPNLRSQANWMSGIDKLSY